MKGKQAQAVWNPDGVIGFARFEIGYAADIQRRAGLGLEMGFERGELGRLITRDVTRTQVSAQRLNDCRSASDHERDGKRSAMKSVCGVAQQKERVNSGDDKTRGRVCRDGHVDGLRK